MIEIGIDNQELQDAILKMSGEEGINRYAKREATNEVIAIEKKLVGAFIIKKLVEEFRVKCGDTCSIDVRHIRLLLSGKSNSLLSDSEIMDCINQYWY